ncbi:translocated promoter region b, nuclear basket protein isoform X2 [Narcine bancroftii]|uniref:translocated promoter region b, nuclear basket protein isoform X2 n=1 Tax=Narcine bancroftii TaxID=1343680 RepID=UPI003831111D
MAAVMLQQLLDRAEFAKIPKNAVFKLEKLIADKDMDVDVLKAKYERLKVDSEQQYFEVEKRLTQTQEKLVSETQECQKLREELSTLSNQLKETKDINKELESSKEKLMNTESQLSHAKDELDNEKRELVRTLERRSQELEYLNGDLKRLNDKLIEANSEKVDLQLKLDELQVSEVSIKYREKRLEQEKELLMSQNTWLNTELKTKTDELLGLRREKSNEILELRCNLENKKDEVCSLEEQIRTLKAAKENFEEQVEDLMSKLKESKEQSATMEERFRNELNAHVKLSNLYKSAAEDSETKATELTRAVEELHNLLKQANEAHKVTEDRLTETETSKTRAVTELNEKIIKLAKELENANHLLSTTKLKGAATLSEEELAAMSPTAAAVAKIVKPGMKLTELYNGYVEAQDQLLLAKQENKRVNKYLDEIVKEVEMKAPLLKRQREEYERVQKSVANLSAKLEDAMKEIRRLQKCTDEANKHTHILNRENQRYKMQVSDLSQQNRVLLMELEDARGNHILREDEVSSADISSSSEVISQHLVTYRNVEELQQQNQQLLVTVRELADKQEKEEQEKTSSRISELQLNLVDALNELERLREARSHQMQLVESIVRQRDMYRTLLAQMTGVTIPGQGNTTEEMPLISSTPKRSPGQTKQLSQISSTPTPIPTVESAELVQSRTALKELQLHFENYKKEKAENDKMLNEQNEKLQDQLTQMRTQSTKLSTQLEFASKRYEMLQNNVDGFRREIASLRDRCQKLTTTVQKQEHIINSMTQDLRASNEKLALEETRGENLRKEKEMLKMVEIRLTQERDSKFAEHRGQSLLLTNLQAIQLSLERAETETRQRLNSQIEKQEREIEKLKKKCEYEVDQHHLLVRNQDIQIMEVKKQLEIESNLHTKTKELLKSSEKEISALKLQLNNLETKLAETLGSDSKGETDIEDVDNLRAQLRQAEEQATDLRERLKTTSSNLEQYRDMVLSLEESLSKEKQVTEEVRAAVESRLKESAEYLAQLEKRMLEAENEKQVLTDEKHKAIENLEQQTSELRRNLSSLQAELQDAVQRAATAVTNEQQARADCQEQARIASEAQNKYERELMLHAADVEALQIAKEQVSSNAQVRQNLEDVSQKAEAQMLECQAAKAEIERILKDEVSKLTTRCEDLQKQNKLLLEQVEGLSNRMVTTVQETNQSSFNTSFNEEGKSQEQLLEILRFVRREREIAETRFEVAQVEVLRYRQRMENLERELKEVQDSLNLEREKVQVTAKTLAQHDELMKKTETMNVLIETNKMLRDEKERLEQELQQSRAKIRKLESDILPLQESNTELSEKSGMLQAEKKLLDEDLKRWKARAQQLISQQKETDPDEYKKLISEKDTNAKRIQQLTEETGKLKTEVARLNASSSVSQRDVQSLKNELNRVTTDRDKLKQEMMARVADIQEKNKTITQVKKIGRRYKTQYEELKAQYDKVVAETSSQHSADQQAEQSSAQATQDLQEALAQSESRAKALESQTEALQKSVNEKESEVKKLQDEVNQLQGELSRLRQELQEKGNLEEQLRQQIVEKEEKTKKAILVAKQKITQLAGLKEQLAKENEELKQHNEELKQRVSSLDQQREELEVRMSALKSQYDGHITRLKRELKEHQERQHEQREEPQELTKTSEPQRQLDPQRQITLKQTQVSTDRGSSSSSDPPTANIKPTPLVATPSKVAAGPVPGSKSTPRASIRPMVTPATVTGPATTPTATVMPTTQVETQEAAIQSEGPVEHVTVFGSASGTVRSTSPNIPNLSQPILTVQQQQTQATAFVQPTQQTLQVEPTNQELSTNLADVVQNSPLERPSTSTAVFGTVSGSTTIPKRQREDEDETNADNTVHGQDESLEHQSKKLKLTLRAVCEEEHMQEVEESAETDAEMHLQSENLDSQDSITQVVIEEYPPSQLMEDNEETSHPLDLVPQPPEHQQNTQSSQNSQTQTECIIIESDEDPDNEQDQEQEEYEEDEEEEDDDDTGIEDGDGEESNEGSREGEDNYDGNVEVAEGTDPSADEQTTRESAQISEDNSGGEGSVTTTESYTPEAAREQQTVAERQAPRPLRSPRRPPHPLPPRLTIQPPAQELGPPAQRFPPARRPSSSRGGIQLTPGIGGVQHFFDEDDRMVPSTPTLVVPHRSDGFAEAIHSPQVTGVPRFRFGPPEDMNQTSSSQSDLGQLASQGGLGMYETPIYLAAVHEDESGGRSVPTTPLQVHAPVTVFNEGPQTDITEHASQSVPMVATSTSNLSSTVEPGGGDDGDEVFIEGADQEGLGSDVMLEIEGQQEEESAQPSEEADIPSTSQDPPSSSADAAITQPTPFRRVRLYPQMGRTAARGRQFLSRRGMNLSMGGRRGINSNRGNHS